MASTRPTPGRSVRRWMLLAAVALVALTAAVGWLTRESPSGETASSNAERWMPTPADLMDLVGGPGGDRYDVIAVARIGSSETGYYPTEEPPFPGDPDGLWIPYTDFQLIPERILLDDGRRPLVLVIDGLPDYHNPDYEPYEKAGDRYLYFLEYLPEFGAYTSGWADYSRLIVDGDTVMYGVPTLGPVPFAQGTPPAAFIDAVATAIATVYPTPTP